MIELCVEGLKLLRQQSCSTPRAVTGPAEPVRRIVVNDHQWQELAFAAFRRICCGDPFCSRTTFRNSK